MNMSDISSAHLSQLQTTLSSSLLKSSMNTQAAHAKVMMDEFTKEQQQQLNDAPHPTSGRQIDITL